MKKFLDMNVDGYKYEVRLKTRWMYCVKYDMARKKEDDS